MTRFRIFPYKQSSKSAKMLVSALQQLGFNARVLKRENSTYIPNLGDVVINWGSSSVPLWPGVDILNSTLADAQCKLKTLQELSVHGVNIPRFTTDFLEAKDMILHGEQAVVCRTKLKGHSGDGIVIATTVDELVPAPLYTQYVKKKHEFRVHVIKTSAHTYQTFFVQRKARKIGFENPNWQVRNLAGGFVFVECADPLNPAPLSVIEQALKAMKALDLDFGAVDVLWNASESKAYVLEINTACGLEGRTALKYAKVLKDRYSSESGDD